VLWWVRRARQDRGGLPDLRKGTGRCARPVEAGWAATHAKGLYLQAK